MKKLKQQVRSRSVIALLHVRLGWLAAPSLLLSCTTAHLENSTETGNAPVIDIQKVALVVANASVRIVGQPGAVSPGGVTVEATIVGTNEVVRLASNADGSFDIPLSTSADAVVELRAAAGDERSNVVYVTRGGASVGSGAGASLSCMERTNLASQAAANLASKADTSCRTASDCVEISNGTVCTDTCSDPLVSNSAVAGIKAGIETINRDLCASFASEGCTVIALPCVSPPMGPIACVDGQCTRQTESGGQCPSCVTETVSWGPSSGLSTNTISSCGSFARTTLVPPSSCEGAVASCGTSDKATVADLNAALLNPAVEAALASGSTVGGPPSPGGMSTSVKVGSRSFLIANCGTGASCSTVPDGIQRLKTLLQRLADETQCELPACPPNAKRVEDACVRCGAAGGCAEVASTCAIVCSGSSDACSVAGTSCSERGICEAAFCI
jgi:hypothetical protein